MRKTILVVLMILLLSIGMILPTLASNNDVYPNVTEINTYRTVFPLASISAYGIYNDTSATYNIMNTFNVDLFAKFMDNELATNGSTAWWRENSTIMLAEKNWQELVWYNTITRNSASRYKWLMDYDNEGDFNYVSTLSSNNLTYTLAPFAYSSSYNYDQMLTSYLSYANVGANKTFNVRISFKTNIQGIGGGRETVPIERVYSGQLVNNEAGVRIIDKSIMDSICQQLGQQELIVSDYVAEVTLPQGTLSDLKIENIIDFNAPDINFVLDGLDTTFVENGNWFNAIINAVDAFMNAPLFGEGQFTLGGLLVCVLGISIFLAFLRIFAGG